MFRDLWKIVLYFCAVVGGLGILVAILQPGETTSDANREGSEKQASAESAPENLPPEPAPMPEAMLATLTDFKDMDQDDRHDLVDDAIAFHEEPTAERELFIACMGDFAANKNEDLIFNDVFGWCVRERANNPDRFAGHFNELDADDLSVDATIICRRVVESKLVSPASADHPWLDASVYDHGKWRYTVKSYVDSQNAFGAMIRTSYHCEVQYEGTGDLHLVSSWNVLNFSAR